MQNKAIERMDPMTLTEMSQRLLELCDTKDALEAQVKENNAAIEELKLEMAQQMVDEDTPKFTHAGHSFSLLPKISYSKRGDGELAESGLDYEDYLSALREEGLGSIIKETVNARTLQSAITAYVEEHGGLSDSLEAVIRTYEFNDIGCRRAVTKPLTGGKINA